MKSRKIIMSLSLIGLVLSIASCGEAPSEEPKFNKKVLNFSNIDPTFKIEATTIDTYFKEDGNVPYVLVFDLINKLDGFIDADTYSKSINGNVVHYEVVDNSNNSLIYMDIDTEKDLIKTNCDYFLTNINYGEVVDYDSEVQFLDQLVIKDGKAIVYNLKKYNLDVFLKDDDALVSVAALQPLLFGTTISHLFYNGEQFYFYGNYVFDSELLYKTRNKNIEGTDIPQDLLDERNNQLYYILDNFYGLKDLKHIDNFKDYIASKDSVYNNLISKDPTKINDAFNELLITDFDDPHTNAGFKNYYQTVNSKEEMTFSKNGHYSNRSKILSDNYNKLYGYYDEYIKNPSIIMFENNTAFIKFDGFLKGLNEQIYNSDGTIKEDAWKYDTTMLVRKALDYTLNNMPQIENVVIDLSTNTGGEIYSIFTTLGLITNKDVYYAKSTTINGNSVADVVRTDADLDGDFEDDDAYDQYNYYILTSPTTFSAANYFTAAAKDIGAAKVIGQKSSGGSCMVFPENLIDGQHFNMSSTLSMAGLKNLGENKYEPYSIEYGVDVDFELPLEKFYDLKYIDNFINNEINTK